MSRAIPTLVTGLFLGALLVPTSAQAGPLDSPLAPRFALELDWPTDSQSDDEDGELSIEERRAIQNRLKLRRKLVDVHQAFSIVAAGSIIAADILGIANKVALDSGAPIRSKLDNPLMAHRVLAGTALTSYLGAGIVAWTMPPALRLNQGQGNSKKLDSGKLHVALSIIHGIAMATVITTGVLQANVTPAGRGWDALVTTHSVAGFTAAGFVLAAGITIGTL